MDASEGEKDICKYFLKRNFIFLEYVTIFVDVVNINLNNIQNICFVVHLYVPLNS